MKNLVCYVRSMRQEDIAQVAKIDREAFSTQLPPPDFHYELRNKVAHYIVACDKAENSSNPVNLEAPSGNNSTGLSARLINLFRRRHFVNNELPPTSAEDITGFAGFWVIANEAHITSIAVREAHRHQSIGELLMISVLDRAKELKAHMATLEVRASNAIAQSLYTKYGFTQVGIRRGYYTDNREDGILMSTQDITSAAFQARLQHLKQAYYRKNAPSQLVC
ncbi:MAG: ribosomal protein S18-alanine N-acetyltransferase [Chloroflexi bacterium]|nr:ribosomal protein S18-alanine N-acetyltransferase [Chloroflexota bacterium]MBI2980024.1 ribosomal protein S18-alanine N-acetyltransferase [Chloroflexota bacterium]